MEDIDEIHSGIMRKLESGPSLILEISENIEKDTLQTQTITDYFVSKGEIKKTRRKFGSSPVYYLEKDKNKALDLLMQTLNNQEKALVSRIRSEKVVNMKLLTPAERYISQNLDDFIKKVSAQDDQTGEKSDYLYEQGISLEDVKKIINEKEGKTENKKAEKPPQILKEDTNKAHDNSTLQILERNGFENAKQLEKDLFLCDYGIKKIKVIVQIIRKRSIGKKEFIGIMGYGSAYKTVAFIITNAQKVASSKSFGSMVTVIRDEL